MFYYASVRMRKRGSLCVRVCTCVSSLCRLLQLLKDQQSASKGFYRLLVSFLGFKLVDLQNNASFSSYVSYG